jgi:SpoVK/Ycf46/Vps4 family AAA+-type ATPase
VDEIDALAIKDSDKHKDTENALTELWCKISQNSSNGRLLIIFVTNKLDKMPAAFSNRIFTNVIHIPNPDTLQRAEILHDYIQCYNMPRLNQDTLNQLTQGLSQHESLDAQLNVHIKNIHDLLTKLDDAVQHKKIDYEIAEKEVKALCANIEEQNNVLYQQLAKAGSQGDGQHRQAMVLLKAYATYVADYCQCAKNLAEGTEGMSVRMLKNLAISIRKEVEKYGDDINKVPWDMIIADKLKSAQEQLAREQKHSAEKEIQEEMEKLTKEVTLIDLWRKVSSEPHYASTRSATTTISGGLGPFANAAGSATIQNAENKQYPATQELVERAKQEPAHSLHSRIAALVERSRILNQSVQDNQ